MTPHESYSITIYLRTLALSDISHKQREKNTDNQTNRTVIKIRSQFNYSKTCMCYLGSGVNDTHTKAQSVKYLIRNLYR